MDIYIVYKARLTIFDIPLATKRAEIYFYILLGPEIFELSH